MASSQACTWYTSNTSKAGSCSPVLKTTSSKPNQEYLWQPIFFFTNAAATATTATAVPGPLHKRRPFVV
ncbi:hypothetical protein ASPACDRAFT_127756 [Aspergillus aculeatus ATCC 16872]|uniref:Uncharacterized protein n=1 Tax=Aspergillus aculeatus (strain ATCC 16872 / CBS 172.66 / WB 5094) TaxID=690307 RepID=A0A1L9WFA1_ASPA1|nr:uncharacterized protein ASPACDRAFT_127756 [Aspergillus aculeatus ATCC 16872]OJJ94866.1 hypothetical protein ASPACDRAFT_127756 [Aspergillus aculeatus ATCC 16872]